MLAFILSFVWLFVFFACIIAFCGVYITGFLVAVYKFSKIVIKQNYKFTYK